MTVIDHPTRSLWYGAGAAGAVCECDPRVTEVARARSWARHRRQRLTAEAWGWLVMAEICAVYAPGNSFRYAPGHKTGATIGSGQNIPKTIRLVVITSATLQERA